VKRVDLRAKSWQLKVFSRSFKKKEKLRLLIRILNKHSVSGPALFVTCGGNSGALNFRLRESTRPQWHWGELERENIAEMEQFLNDKIAPVSPENPELPVAEGFYEAIILMDVLEHVAHPEVFSGAILRYLKEEGLFIIGTPTGNSRKPLLKLKRILGMKPELYGHLREGFSGDDLRALNSFLELETREVFSYSHFWTELLELVINFLLLKIFNRRFGAKKAGNIAPQSSSQFRGLASLFRVYLLLYPFFVLLSLLDKLIFFTEGYAFLSVAKGGGKKT
jgi:SAM-dependent methyltransferase